MEGIILGFGETFVATTLFLLEKKIHNFEKHHLRIYLKIDRNW